MVQYTRGNLLKPPHAEALVNAVNCVGVMGRGIAAQFKRTYPENFRAYEAACKRKEVVPGRMFVFATGQITNPRFILNFPTKHHWRDQARIEDIEIGLATLVVEVQTRSIKSIALPALGCGLGCLDWQDVYPLIERAFSAMPDVHALVYQPWT